MIQISRNGEVVGTYSREEIEQLICRGALEPTDHFWREGMIEWKPLTTLDFYIPKGITATPSSLPTVHQTDIGHYVEKTRKLKVRGALMMIIGAIMVVIGVGAAKGHPTVVGIIGTLMAFMGFFSFVAGRMRQ